jgi:hypothetical protein
MNATAANIPAKSPRRPSISDENPFSLTIRNARKAAGRRRANPIAVKYVRRIAKFRNIGNL